MDLDRIRQEILTHLEIDWVELWLFPHLLHEIGGVRDEAKRREVSMALIRELLESGIIEAGEIDWEKKRFVPWLLGVEETIGRIESEWTQLGREPGMSEIGWFSLTEKGETKAQSKPC